MRAHHPLELALHRVGDRWTLLLVDALLGGPLRFGDLASAVPGIAPNILVRRLRSLEQAGLVHTEPYSERPVRLRYELTEAGRELAGALHALAAWGARNGGGEGDGGVAGRFHEVCGTPLEQRLWCPTCDRVVDDDEGDELVRL